jgi:hypothetical protein
MAQRQLSINVFHDERILPEHGWLYHGMLFVPSILEEWLLTELINLRDGYDGFLHFVDLRNPAAQTPEGRKALVAKKWATFFLNDTKHSRQVVHHNNFCALVFGINLKKLNHDCFGERADENIFNRFFRSTLLSGIRLFYSSDFDVVNVQRVFHGTSQIASDNPLLWHPMWRIEQEADGSIVFQHPQLTLLAADHRQEKTWPAQSHLIQFTDLFLGSFSQCLDCSSSARGCIEVARELQPVIERLTTNPLNKNSRYYRKYSASFFPSERLTLEELGTQERHRSKIYTGRRLKIVDLNQPGLF